MEPGKKLEVLKGSLESGAIDKKEFDDKKIILEKDIEEHDKKAKKEKGDKPDEEEKEVIPFSSEKILLIVVGAIILIILAVYSYNQFRQDPPETLEDLHDYNIRGKLKPEQGYMYKGAYSFVKLNDLWYTQLKSPKGTKLFDMVLRYSPRDVQEIDIVGSLDVEFFDAASDYYVTFDPTGTEFAHISLAVADFNTHLSKVFEKKPIAACDRNETSACIERPIVTCDDKDKIVLYIKESNETKLSFESNCIIVEGLGLNLVKGVDRVLFNLYGIMEKVE
jgi:hypothetical protein